MTREPSGPKVAGVKTDPAPGTPQYGPTRVAAFVRVMAAAYRAAGATSGMVPLLVAHSALAVGWGRNVWNWNIGVIRAGASWAGPWADVSTIEWQGGQHVRRPRAAWRAYADLTASSADVLELLSTSKRYRGAWALLQRSDPAWFAAAGRAGWYTEPAAVHSRRYAAVLARVRRTLERT